MSISVGVECDIGEFPRNEDTKRNHLSDLPVDILFIHIHISISLGADLELWGPDAFGGLAHVHFWFFGKQHSRNIHI
jgi:hypothetical protein